MPKCGLSVVNGYEATLGVALDSARSKELFPALGKPTYTIILYGQHNNYTIIYALTSPTSARSFISKRNTTSLPSSP